jgi:hypothetical protein
MSRKDSPRMTRTTRSADTPALSLVPTAAEIDTLYQRPLSDFTAARNELAKRAGKTDPSIKALEKPSVPAWAVNQLYWRERALYDELMAASEALRKAHRAVLAGKTADLGAAERAHRDALRGAVERSRTLLADAGEAATPATMTAVSETLSALPAEVTPGRLTRPLKPGGFEVLTGVPARPPGAAPARPPRPALVKTDSTAAAREAAAARKAAEAAAREAAKEKDRREGEVKKAKASLDKAQAAVSRAEEEVAEHERALSEARKTRDRLQVEAQLAFNEYQHATRRARE